MESFRANLASYRLPLMVPALFDRKLLTGTLRLSRGAIRRDFHFRDGLLISASSNEPREHLAQVLSNLNILDVARSASAFEAAHGSRVPLGAFLIERGFVDRPRLLEALSHKAREGFFDCYAWESGEIELVPETVPNDVGVALRIPLGALHRDALARLREWRTFRDVLPTNECTFRVHREMAVDWRSEEEERLILLAESGATLGELLATAPEGQLFSARRVLQMYRRGVLSPRTPSGPVVGEICDVAHLIDLTRSLLSKAQYEAAADVASQALERAPVPEACALYREAEQRMAAAVSEEVLSLEGRLQFQPLPRPAPSLLTADDLYVYSLLRSARSVRDALRASAMGEVAAHRCVRRLVTSGVIRLLPEGTTRPERKTNPYGIPAIA